MKLVPKPKPVAESCLSGKRLLCFYQKPNGPRCEGAKTILGKVKPWPDGKGYQQGLWCTHCPARGVISANLTPRHGIRGLVLPKDDA